MLNAVCDAGRQTCMRGSLAMLPLDVLHEAAASMEASDTAVQLSSPAMLSARIANALGVRLDVLQTQKITGDGTQLCTLPARTSTCLTSTLNIVL